MARNNVTKRVTKCKAHKFGASTKNYDKLEYTPKSPPRRFG